MTPSQPSPNNLSDELDKILATYKQQRYDLDERYRSNRLGWKVDDGSAEQDLYVRHRRIDANEKAAITTAYAEAINAIIGDELDYEKYGKCPSCGAAYMYQCTCDQGSLYTINQQRQRLQRLLPTNASDEGSAGNGR